MSVSSSYPKGFCKVIDNVLTQCREEWPKLLQSSEARSKEQLNASINTAIQELNSSCGHLSDSQMGIYMDLSCLTEKIALMQKTGNHKEALESILSIHQKVFPAAPLERKSQSLSEQLERKTYADRNPPSGPKWAQAPAKKAKEPDCDSETINQTILKDMLNLPENDALKQLTIAKMVDETIDRSSQLDALINICLASKTKDGFLSAWKFANNLKVISRRDSVYATIAKGFLSIHQTGYATSIAQRIEDPVQKTIILSEIEAREQVARNKIVNFVSHASSPISGPLASPKASHALSRAESSGKQQESKERVASHPYLFDWIDKGIVSARANEYGEDAGEDFLEVSKIADDTEYVLRLTLVEWARKSRKIAELPEVFSKEACVQLVKLLKLINPNKLTNYFTGETLLQKEEECMNFLLKIIKDIPTTSPVHDKIKSYLNGKNAKTQSNPLWKDLLNAKESERKALAEAKKITARASRDQAMKCIAQTALDRGKFDIAQQAINELPVSDDKNNLHKRLILERDVDLYDQSPDETLVPSKAAALLGVGVSVTQSDLDLVDVQDDTDPKRNSDREYLETVLKTGLYGSALKLALALPKTDAYRKKVLSTISDEALKAERLGTDDFKNPNVIYHLRVAAHAMLSLHDSDEPLVKYFSEWNPKEVHEMIKNFIKDYDKDNILMALRIATVIPKSSEKGMILDTIGKVIPEITEEQSRSEIWEMYKELIGA
jgi:hypothetical protein